MPHFYATAEDLLPVFTTVAAKHSYKYALCGQFAEAEIRFFFSGRELPTLGKPAESTNANSGFTYLVTERNTVVSARKLPPLEGITHFAVDQLSNPDSILLAPGGFFGEQVLLYGRIETCSKSATAVRIQRSFSSAIKKHFARIQAFYVGPQAECLLDRGFRLTIGASSPSEYDLQR